MKIRTILISALSLFVLASCSKDEKGTDGGRGEETTMTLIVTQEAAAPSRAFDDSALEAPSTDESKISGNVKVVIFDNAKNLEKSVDAAVTANKTTNFKISSGKKYVYVLANIPSAAVVDYTTGKSLEDFEKQIQTLSQADVSTPEHFFMTNVQTPEGYTIVTGVTDPAAENKNQVKVKIGRVAAKITVEFTATAATSEGGTLSGLEYKVGSMAKKTYTVGQFESGQLKTPFYSSATIDAADHGDEAAYKALATVSYVLENANAEPQEGNTTRLMVKGTFTPKEWLNGTDGTVGTASADGTFWFVVDASNNVVGYANSDPAAGDGWAAGHTSTKYQDGTSYYNKVWIMDYSESVKTKKYSVIRNHSYKVNINRINGPGSSTENGNVVDPTDPVETETEMLADIKVLDWWKVEQDSTLEQ